MSKINPVKWSTQKIKDLFIQIDQTGVIPRYNPFYNNDSALFAAAINFGYTEEELFDKARSIDDIFYFAITHVKIKTDEGEIQEITHLRDYQKNLIHHFKEYRFNIVLASRQIGKCVHPFTMLSVEMGSKIQELPIFEVFFQSKPKLSILDKLTYFLLRSSYSLSRG